MIGISETQFVEMLRRRAARHAGRVKRSGLRRGIGEDCAVIAGAKNDLLVTTDLFLEGVHFRRKWIEPGSIGHKVLARGLSDIAAMGGTPRYVFLSLGLPGGIERGWMDAFLDGFFKLAEAEKVILAGGDTGASKSGFVADIIVVGEAPRGGAVLRSGARPGDEIWVTGRLGLASLGLQILEARKRRNSCAEALEAFYWPQPRLRIGRLLRERKLASAMIDLSDGLSLDLARLCKESGVGARVFEAEIPRTEETPLRNALHGGEDLELLFTVPAAKSRAVPRSIGGVRLTRIGQVISSAKPGKKLRLVRGAKEQPLPILGFQHF